MNNANPMFNNHAQFSNSQYPQGANGNPQDLSLAFGNLSNLNPSNLDYGQFPNPQLQQQRFAGDAPVRHQSPGFQQHPGYQVNQVIPAKRPRVGNDTVGASPRAAPGLLGAQRSQTPQQQPQQGQNNLYGAQGGAPGFQQPPNPFPHMQNAGSHHSPSPAPSNTSYNPQMPGQQRQPTSSPHQYNAGISNYNNFNAAQPQNAIKNNIAGATNTPQMMRAMQPGQGYGQGPAGQLNMMGQGQQGQMPPGGNTQNQDAQALLQQQQQQYRIKLQQAQQAIQQNNSAAAQNRPQAFDNPAQTPATPATNGISLGQQAQPAIQATPNRTMMQNAQTEQNFLARLQSYALQNQLRIEPRPMICGRPVNYYNIFMAVNNHKILLPGPTLNNWGMIANALGFPPAENPSAVRELETLFDQNMRGFVTTWMTLMNKKRQQMQQQQMGGRQLQTSPTSATGSQLTGAANNAFSPPAQTSSQATPSQRKASLPPTGLPQQQSLAPSSSLESRQPSMPRTSSLSDVFQAPFSRKQSAQVDTPPAASDSVNSGGQAPHMSAKAKIQAYIDRTHAKSTEYNTRAEIVDTYGGLELHSFAELGDELQKVKPGMPQFEEMGIIDIHALTLGIMSGMHGEIRHALDQILALSADARPGLALSLIDCEGLVDALIECAEEQLDFLEGEAAEESDEIELPYFEDLLKLARDETESLQERNDFAGTDYERSQAAERLIAITAIIRNISFADSAVNHDLLASPPLIVLLSTLIRLLGTRSMLLYSHRNAADFMKDTVTLLSNISHRIELPGREEAHAILHLLTAFAPAPPSSSASVDKITFAFYDPSKHHYLPSAVDALAKLLARDEPNRSFYKSIFNNDNGSPPSAQLLTRAFSLAISPIPDRNKGHLVGAMELRLADARKPFFCQGMLAADILASLLPNTGDADGARLAEQWLESDDDWTRSLMHMVLQLAMDPNAQGPPIRHPTTGRIMYDESRGFALITRKALSMLSKLVRKVDRPRGKHDDGKDNVASIFRVLSSETVLLALCSPGLDPETLRSILACASLDA